MASGSMPQSRASRIGSNALAKSRPSVTGRLSASMGAPRADLDQALRWPLSRARFNPVQYRGNGPLRIRVIRQGAQKASAKLQIFRGHQQADRGVHAMLRELAQVL